MKKLLLVIDMQNDFVTGVLGTRESQSVVHNVEKKIKQYEKNGDLIIFTKDTHFENYLNTAEGTKLPIPHCLDGTWGHSLVFDSKDYPTIKKDTFGLGKGLEIVYNHAMYWNAKEIELIGLCTDVCVVTNALDLKTRYPEFLITIDASCCAGTSPEAHDAAIRVMKSCQIDVINYG